jgi:hypothetical protein
MVDELFLKAFERLSNRVAVLEAAQAAPVAPPTPESDAEPDTVAKALLNLIDEVEDMNQYISPGVEAAIERAKAVVSTPEPDGDSIDRLAAIIRKVNWNHDLSAYGLAEAILWDRDAAGVFPILKPGSVVAGLPDTSHLAPPPWPVLPAHLPEWPDAEFPPDYREGRRSGWLAARKCLAAMNPSLQQEGRNDG